MKDIVPSLVLLANKLPYSSTHPPTHPPTLQKGPPIDGDLVHEGAVGDQHLQGGNNGWGVGGWVGGMRRLLRGKE